MLTNGSYCEVLYIYIYINIYWHQNLHDYILKTEISAFGQKLGYNWHLQHEHKEYEQYQS